MVFEQSGPNSLKIKYLEKGHTFMRSDSIHRMIGKALKKDQVFDFDDLLKLMKGSMQGLTVQQLTPSDFIGFLSVRSRKGLPKLKGVRQMRFEKGSTLLRYKLNISAASYFSRHLSVDAPASIPPSENRARGINQGKKAEICRLLVPQMPPEKRSFWQTLPESELPDLCVQ